MLRRGLAPVQEIRLSNIVEICLGGRPLEKSKVGRWQGVLPEALLGVECHGAVFPGGGEELGQLLTFPTAS